MDYAAIAQKYGGTAQPAQPAPPKRDLVALAAKHGGQSSAKSAPPPQMQSSHASEGIPSARKGRKPKWANEHPDLYDKAVWLVKNTELPAEIAGQVTGAVLGTAAGAVASPSVVANPVTGGLAGGALGYGMVGQAYDYAKELLGMEAPPKDMLEAAKNAMGNVGEGAAMEMGGAVAGKVLAKPAAYVASKVGRGLGVAADAANRVATGKTTQAATRRASRVASDAVAENPAAIRGALDSAPAGMTASQAVAREIDPATGKAVVNAPAAQALLKQVEKERPGLMTGITRQQESGHVNQLAEMAGGKTGAESVAATDEMKDVLNKLAGNIREPVLARANATTVQGASASGLQPINPSQLEQTLLQMVERPEYTANEPLRRASGKIVKEIQRMIANGETLTADKLYALRKNSLGTSLASAQGGAQLVDKKLAQKYLVDAKGVIDDAIEAAGGPQWRQYLAYYSKGMDEIGRTQFGAKLMDMYKNSPNTFTKIVTNNKPDILRKLFGPGNEDLAKAMGKEAAERLGEMGRYIQSGKDAATQASAGAVRLDSILKDHALKFRLPSYLSVVSSTTNKTLDVLEQKLGAKTLEVLSKAAENAKNFTELLDNLPLSERNKVLKALKDPETYRAFGAKVAPRQARGAAATTINALSTEQDRQQQTQNRLAQ